MVRPEKCLEMFMCWGKKKAKPAGPCGSAGVYATGGERPVDGIINYRATVSVARVTDP